MRQSLLLALVMLSTFVPGAPIAIAAGRRRTWSIPLIVAASFSVTAAVVGVAGVVGHGLGWSVGGTTAISAVLLLVCGILAFGDVRRTPGHVDRTAQGIVVALAAGALAWFERPWMDYVADSFYHLAAARSLLARGESLVTDPFYATGATTLDPTSGAFHTWLAMLSRATGMEVETLLPAFTVVGTMAVVLAFWGLAYKVSKSGTISSLVTITFVLLANYGDVRLFGLPNRYALAFVLVAIAVVPDVVSRGWPVAVVAVATAVAAYTMHLASAGLIIMVVLTLTAWYLVLAMFSSRGTEHRWRVPQRIVAALVTALVVAVPLLWSRVSVLGGSSFLAAPEKPATDMLIALGGGLVVVRPGLYVGGGAAVFFMTAMIGVAAAWIGLKRHDESASLAAPIVLLPAAFLFFPPVTTLAVSLSPYMTARLALMLKFVPFLAVAWALGEALHSRREEKDPPVRARVYPGVVALVGVAILMAHTMVSWPLTEVTFVRIDGQMRNGEAYTVFESRTTDIRDSWGMPALWDARAAFADDYPIVAASPETGYYLAGLANCAIVAAPPSHSPIAVETTDGPQRRQDMEMLLAPEASLEVREEILDRRDADYVALSPGRGDESLTWESMQQQPELFEPVVVTRRFVLMRVLQ